MKAFNIILYLGTFTIFCCNGQNIATRNDQTPLDSKSIQAENGINYDYEIGHLKVPENRDNPNSKSIEIGIFRLKTKNSNPLAPIFIFDGGPGDVPSTIQNLEQLIPVLSQFAEKSDVVIMEQRGNGISKPNLTCPGNFSLPLDVPLTPELALKEYRRYVKECSDYWQLKGIDFRGYNVESMSADTDAVRNYLGYEKIMIFGGSFGSHHGLDYLRRYSGNVDRVILTLPEGMNNTVKYPFEVDKVLDQLSDLVKQDSQLSKHFPSFKESVRRLLSKLEESPVKTKTTHPSTNEEVNIVLGKYDLQLVTALELGRIDYRSLPRHYIEMEEGDFNWLANYSIYLRVHQSRNLMAILTDCASGATEERWQLVRQQATEAILGDALNDINFGACEYLDFQDIGDEYRKNFYSDVPILIIYGSQDARTPPRNAMELIPFFKNGKLMEVKYASHDMYREAFGALAPYMIGYFIAADPFTYKVPRTIDIGLELK